MAEKKKKAAAKPPANAGAAKPAGTRIKLIVILLLALLLLGGAGFAVYYFFLQPKPAEPTEGMAGAEGTGAPQTPAAQSPQPAPTPAQPAPPPTPVYHNLGSFTVNLNSAQARFLRVGLVVSTLSPLVPAALDKHKPRLRNDILSLLATQDFALLNTPEGKEALREALRQTLVRALASSGEPSDIRDVLFNDLIMQ